MLTLSLDIGTTNVKGGILIGSGDIVCVESANYEVIRKGGEHYIDIGKLSAAVFKIIGKLKRFGDIRAVCISSLGESFVPIDRSGNAIADAMLYSDTRAESECAEIVEKIGRERIIEITGLNPHYMYSLPKIVWLKKHCSEIYKNTYKFLLIGDYVGYLLSGEFAIDYSLASRTMAFDVHKKVFSSEILGIFGINADKFSTPIAGGEIIGKVKTEILPNCYLISGGHDQICACLGSGAIESGKSNNGIGTVECITPVFSQPPKSKAFAECGYSLVPYVQGGLYATYAFNFTGGVAMQWFKENIVKRNFEDFHAHYEANMPNAPTDLLFLPHLLGSGTPQMDSGAKGALLNLTLETTDFDIYRAIIEGTCFEMLMNIQRLKEFGIVISEATASGGGAKSLAWLRAKADIYGLPIYPLQSGEAGLVGCAMMAFKALKEFSSYCAMSDIFVKRGEPVLPNIERHMNYLEKFEVYKRIYKQIKIINGGK